MANPAQQGLKQPFDSLALSTAMEAVMANPAQQGLKLHGLSPFCAVFVAVMANPAQQGLKHKLNRTPGARRESAVMANPAQQGLKPNDAANAAEETDSRNG